jgi:hypothetical protein
MAVATSTAIVAGATAATVAALKYKADRDKRRAQQKAAKKSRQGNNQGTGQATTELNAAYIDASKTYDDNMQKAQEALSQGNKDAAAAYTEKANLARADLESGFGQARTDLSAGYGQSRDALSAGYGKSREGLQSQADLAHYGEDALTGKGFETSGGYQFRLDQGNQALSRMQAASGGRLSGAALKKAGEYNQGFASNEYNNWANRASQLGQVGYGAQRGIADYYAQEGQGLSSLYSREGEGLSNLSVARGGALGQLDINSGQYLGGLAERGGNNLSNLYGQWGTNQANMRMGLGNSLSNAYTGNAAANSALNFAGTEYAGAGANALAEGVGSFGTLMSYGMGRYGAQTQGGPSSPDRTYYSDEELGF